MSANNSPPRIFDRPHLRRRLELRPHRTLAGTILADRVRAELLDRLDASKAASGLALDVGGLVAPLPGWQTVALAPSLPAAKGLHNGGVAALVGDEERLPLAFGRFAIIVSAFALSAVNDLPGSLIQIARALQPGGRFLGAVFGEQTLQELRRHMAEAEIAATGGVSPRVAPFLDVRDAGALLQRAGFEEPVADRDLLTLRYADPGALLKELRQWGLANPLAERKKTPLSRSVLAELAQAYSAAASPDGRIAATIEIVFLSGRAPAQKPASTSV
ncbi:MAG: methyltransferase domain-containing protein [Alphaproteobacteria bacterium]|nr:methyltransferase domain-containing protein [Alphaproteobacteria bacterium]